MEVGVKQSSALVFLCLPLAFLLLQKLPRGVPRLLFVFLPSLPLLAWLPFTIPIHCLRSFLAFCFLWVCPTKLLLLCWDISIDHTTPPPPYTSFSYFIFYIIAPLRIKGPALMKRSKTTDRNPATTRSSYKPPSFPLFLFNLFSLIAVINCCMYFRDKISIWFLYALFCVEVYVGLETYMSGLSFIAYYMLGVDTYPAHNSPFMASSLSDFWGKRWNVVVTTLLRASVYDPILLFLCSPLSKKEVVLAKEEEKMESAGDAVHKIKNESVNMVRQGVKRAFSNQISSNATGLVANHGEIRNRPPLAARAIAMLATFAVSGLIHEAIFCCMTQSHATWEATAFFILHGVSTVIELTLRRYLPTSFKFPRFLCIGFTLGFLYMTICWLFLPPVHRSGTELIINTEFYEAQALLLSRVM